ncbi:MAG: phosphoribosyltransferase [Candidatus Woesearchaeota archaeon]
MEPTYIPDDDTLPPVLSITTTKPAYVSAEDHWRLEDYVKDDFAGVLIPNSAIQRRIKDLAVRVNDDYKDKRPHFIWVADGAWPFFRDFKEKYRAIAGNGFSERLARVKSYDGTSSTGERKFLDVNFSDVAGKDVVLFEDIIDTGGTMKDVLAYLRQHGPASVKVATLLDKRVEKTSPVRADYALFSIPDEFVVGYGLDFNDSCRDLDDIYVLSQQGQRRLA